uniref:Uncharacterized protein n=1 Tax=Chromera velia CCMP2878 TaxID=1169474 RepID=A0A0G4IE04_9ALVE|eukprot:Cvel_13457.t1-p1 / transcript=Cvel_13457.t1 / gene=Cvel_13457 / organism=Chromera_velia_CCMP2878 / gene_product=hypothetical protein / transcript_product=hypothetical protein / location=Cvel_scaffold919:56739-57149(+) / protein_length=137 / sequence_SO=supercontig / SO=protein_coding / is_pseudo=false
MQQASVLITDGNRDQSCLHTLQARAVAHGLAAFLSLDALLVVQVVLWPVVAGRCTGGACDGCLLLEETRDARRACCNSGDRGGRRRGRTSVRLIAWTDRATARWTSPSGSIRCKVWVETRAREELDGRGAGCPVGPL